MLGGLLMPPEILALAAKPQLLFVVVTLCVFAGMLIEQLLSKMRRAAWRRRNPSRFQRQTKMGSVSWLNRRDESLSKASDPVDQLRIVMAADFTIQPLLNKSEARVFKELDQIVISCNPTWQVMAQVSLGEILRCQDADAYGCINSKRVDLLLMDSDCQPRHAIEYQGKGHYIGSAAARDAVKKEALRRAGIGYHEVVAGSTTPTELRRLVEKLVDKPGSSNW
jgi:hypothetical protein